MNMRKWWFISTILVAVCTLLVMQPLTADAAGPYLVVGTVNNADNSVPADTDVTFTAYIASRPGEILTQASNGCGYSLGLYFVEVGNFPTAWSVNDVLVVDLLNLSALQGKTKEMILDGSFGEDSNVVLEPIAPQTLTIAPVNPTVQVPNTQQFTATATFAEVAGSQDVTASVTWESSNTTTGTMNAAGLFTPSLAGTTVITAELGGVTSNASTVTVIAGPPDAGTSTVAADPTASIPASTGASFSTVTVTVKDVNGNAVSGQTVTITLDGTASYINGTPYTAPVALPTPTNASGVVTFQLSSTKAETVEVTAAVGATTITDTENVTFMAAAFSSGASTVNASAPTQTTDGGATITVTVTLVDAFGNPVAGQNVSLASTGTGNTIVPPAAATDASGQTSGTIASTKAEEKTITASIGAVALTNTATVTFEPGDANRMTLQASRTTLASDTKGSATLTARILDQNNNLVTSDNATEVTFTLTDVTYAVITGSPATAVAGEANATVTTTVGTVPVPPATTDVSITSDPVLTPPAAVTLTIVNFSIQVNAPAAPFVDGTGVHLVTSASTPTTATFEGVGGTSTDYRWALAGVGTIDSTTADAITYTAPATITGDSQTATLTLTSASDGALTDTITITVYNPVAVTWPTALAGIVVGDNTKIVTASGGTGAYEFESSNGAVATVAADGTITALAAETITVKVKDATYGDFGEENGFLAVTPNIQVVDPIVISGPTAVDTAGTETYTFVGGTGEVNWTADSGSITAAGVFTAPAVPSGSVSVTITATDQVFSDIMDEYTVTVFGSAAIVEKPAGYVDGQPLTYPLVTAALTLSAQDATRSYDWVVTDWNDNPIVSQTTGAATFTLDPDVLFAASGAGVYTVTLTDRDNPDLAPATLKVRIPMRFFSDDFFPADSGTYTVPPSVDDAYGADGGPAANVYVYGIYDLAGVEVADGVYGSFTDASPTGDANVFTFAAGIETLVSYRVKVSLDPASADADVVRLRDAGLDEVWSGIFRIVPVVEYSGKVVELDGVTPVAGATVVATHDFTSAVTTDGSGDFTTPGFELTGVTYTFLVRKDGYVDKIVTGAEIEAGPILLEALGIGAGTIQGIVTFDDAVFSGRVEIKVLTLDGTYVQDASGVDIVAIAHPTTGAYMSPVPANFAARGPFDVEFRRSGYIFDAAAGLGVLTGVAINATDADVTLLPVTRIFITATPRDTTIPPDGVLDEVLVEIEAEAGAVPEEFDGTVGEIKVTVTGVGDITGTLTYGANTYSFIYGAHENFTITVEADVSEDRDVDAGYKAVRTFTFIKSAVQNETAVDPILGGSATSPSGDNVVTVPPGGLTGDILGGLSVVIVEINAEEAGATRIIGSEILEVYLVDENGDRVPNGKIARIEIKLKFDPTVVLPGTLENGTFVIFQASSVTDLIAGRATPVPRGQIIPVVDYTNGFVTFWVDHLSAFGIGAAPAAPGPTPTPTPTPVGGGGGGGCFISTMTDGPVYPVWVATLFLVIFASAAWIVRRAAK